MRPRPSITVAMATSLALAAALIASGVAVAGGRPITVAPLTGAAEAPNPGDPDGTGWVRFWFNPGQGVVCYDYAVSGVATLAAAHIHVAPAGSAGPFVIPTPPTRADGGTGCVSADRDLQRAILTHPGAYYFNVHNAAFPAGALRGQLSRTP